MRTSLRPRIRCPTRKPDQHPPHRRFSSFRPSPDDSVSMRKTSPRSFSGFGARSAPGSPTRKTRPTQPHRRFFQSQILSRWFGIVARTRILAHARTSLRPSDGSASTRTSPRPPPVLEGPAPTRARIRRHTHKPDRHYLIDDPPSPTFSSPRARRPRVNQSQNPFEDSASHA